MKRVILLKVLALAVMVSVTTVGCKKRQEGVTHIPKVSGPVGTGNRMNPPMDSQLPIRTDRNNPNINELETFGPGSQSARPGDNFTPDREKFQANSVYFDFDRSTIKPGEKGKIDEIAVYLKSSALDRIEVEGHCDERGTEEYNRSLGERRALALREYLVNAGVDANRISTRSWGEDRPASMEKNEQGYAKNRRGEFILLKPSL